MAEPEHKYGMIVQRDWIYLFFRNAFQSELPSIRILGESFYTNHMSLIFTRNLPYTLKFLRKIHELISTGVMKTFQADILDDRKPRKEEDVGGPQILTLRQLGLGFCLYLIACGICIVVFLLEVLFGYLKMLKAKRSNRVIYL